MSNSRHSENSSQRFIAEQIWAMQGEPIPQEELNRKGEIDFAGDVNVRIVATLPVRVLLALSILIAFFPRMLAYPLVALSTWIAFALFCRGYKLYAQRRGDASADWTTASASLSSAGPGRMHGSGSRLLSAGEK